MYIELILVPYIHETIVTYETMVPNGIIVLTV
jgi:hypothetical protein